MYEIKLHEDKSHFKENITIKLKRGTLSGIHQNTH